MQSPDTPIPTPMPQRLADFRRRELPVVLWLLCAAICAWMLYNRGRTHEYVALAQAAEYEISAPRTGRIDDVLVSAFDPVSRGEIVAQLVDDELRGRGIGRALVAAAEAELAERGAAGVRLTSRADRPAAHGFWEELGYVRRGWHFVRRLAGAD